MTDTATKTGLGTIPIADAKIVEFISHIRHSGWGFPAGNPAADAFIALYSMVMEDDLDDLEGRARDVADSAHEYARFRLGDEE